MSGTHVSGNLYSFQYQTSVQTTAADLDSFKSTWEYDRGADIQL